MAKGYVIFVEGAETPEVVHATFSAAFWHTRRLAERFPDREIMLLQLHKRYFYDSKTQKLQKLGSHVPPNPERKILTTKDLVPKGKRAK